jgi:hypothetical protein
MAFATSVSRPRMKLTAFLQQLLTIQLVDKFCPLWNQNGDYGHQISSRF